MISSPQLNADYKGIQISLVRLIVTAALATKLGQNQKYNYRLSTGGVNK